MGRRFFCAGLAVALSGDTDPVPERDGIRYRLTAIAGSYWDSSGAEPYDVFVNMRKKSWTTPFMGYNSANPETWKRGFGPEADETVVGAMERWRTSGEWDEKLWGCDQEILLHRLQKDAKVVNKNPAVYKTLFNEEGLLVETDISGKNDDNVQIKKVVCGRHIWFDGGAGGKIRNRERTGAFIDELLRLC